MFSAVTIVALIEAAAFLLVVIASVVRAMAERNFERAQEQFLAVLAREPGATVTEIATTLGVERGSLFAVAARLQSERAIARRGSGYSVSL